MKNSKALCTMLYGEKYVSSWRTNCEASWRAYAARHGYDVAVITEPIKLLHPLEMRPIHWQKLFIPAHPELRQYEDVVFLDSDIIINYHRAPCIVAANQAGKIGAVSFDRYVDDDLNYYLVFIRQCKFWNYAARKNGAAVPLSGPDLSAFYRRYAPAADRSWPLLNTGVLVFKPRMHAELLETIYCQSIRDVADGAERGNYEQEYVSCKLLEAGVAHLLDERFNRIFSFEQSLHYPFLIIHPDDTLKRMCYTTILTNCYFLHFAGFTDYMRFVVSNDGGDFAILGLKDVFKGDLETIKNRRHK